MEEPRRAGGAVLFQFGLRPFYLTAQMPVMIKEIFKRRPLEFKVCTVRFYAQLGPKTFNGLLQISLTYVTFSDPLVPSCNLAIQSNTKVTNSAAYLD